MKRVGLIINPMAGVGGTVGLKGSDGTFAKALELGAVPQAGERTKMALKGLSAIKNELTWFSCSGDMGANLLREMDFQMASEWTLPDNVATSAGDTRAAVRWMMDQCVDLILFAGGDGTARDVQCALGEASQLVSLGIPAGVKIHSPVYAKTPVRAGELARLFLEEKVTATAEAEVVDLDEAAYRAGTVKTKLFGYLLVPSHETLLQGRKAPSPLSEAQSQRAIAHSFTESMREGITYIVGPGTTTRTVMEILGLQGTLLGVDVIRDSQVIGRDVSQEELLNLTHQGQLPWELVLTPTGGQGYLLGRGNQQIGAALLRHGSLENLHVLCTKQKLAELRGQPLMVDTGDALVDARFKGYTKVIVGFNECVMYKLDN